MKRRQPSFNDAGFLPNANNSTYVATPFLKFLTEYDPMQPVFNYKGKQVSVDYLIYESTRALRNGDAQVFIECHCSLPRLLEFIGNNKFACLLTEFRASPMLCLEKRLEDRVKIVEHVLDSRQYKRAWWALVFLTFYQTCFLGGVRAILDAGMFDVADQVVTRTVQLIDNGLNSQNDRYIAELRSQYAPLKKMLTEYESPKRTSAHCRGCCVCIEKHAAEPQEKQ